MGRWEAERRMEEERNKPRPPAKPRPKYEYDRRGRRIAPASSESYRPRRAGLDATYPERKPYRSRRQGLDTIYPDRKPPVEDDGGNSSRDTAPPNPGADANAKGTQMGGKAALADFDAFADLLRDRDKISFNFGTSQLPTSGNHHQKLTEPGQNQDGTYKMPEYVMYQGQAVPTKEVFGNDYQGGYYGTAKVGDSADKSDVSRALDFGDDEDDMLYNNYGNEEPIEDEYGGYEGRDSYFNSARGRAFLNHKGSSAMALRAAEAAQGTIRQNGNTYGKNSEGKWVRLSKEAESELMDNGSKIATSQYVTDNTYESKPAEKHAQETLGKHLKANKEKLSHGEYLDLTNDGPQTPETNEVSFKNGKTMTMQELMDNEDLWEENY